MFPLSTGQARALPSGQIWSAQYSSEVTIPGGGCSKPKKVLLSGSAPSPVSNRRRARGPTMMRPTHPKTSRPQASVMRLAPHLHYYWASLATFSAAGPF